MASNGQKARKACEETEQTGQAGESPGTCQKAQNHQAYGPAVGLLAYSRAHVSTLFHRKWLAWVTDVAGDARFSRKHGLYGPTPVSRGVGIIEKAGEAFRAVSCQFKPASILRVHSDPSSYTYSGNRIDGRKDYSRSSGGRNRLLHYRGSVYLAPRKPRVE